MLETLAVTPDEVASGALAPDRLATAVEAIRADGAVVLNDAVATSHIRTLREKMENDIPELLEKVGDNMAKGQLHHSPPPFAPYVFADVVANPVVTSLCAAVIGAPVQLSFFSGNTNLAGSDAQPLHRDLANLWPGVDVSHPPAMLSAHIPLVDMDEHNGATEVWPGTHLLAHMDPPVSGSEGTGGGREPELLARRRAESPPVYASCRAGGVVLRDARGWHRAMPNTTARPRVMLGLVYQAIWMRAGRTLFMRDAEPTLREVGIELNARYTDEPFDYLEDWKVRAQRRREAPKATATVGK